MPWLLWKGLDKSDAGYKSCSWAETGTCTRRLSGGWNSPQLDRAQVIQMGKSQNSWCDVTKILAFCCVWTQKWPGVTRWAYSKSSSWTVAEPRSLGVGEDVAQGKWLLLPLVTAATSHSEHRPATGAVTSQFILHPNRKDKCITSLADVLGLQGYFLRAQKKGRRVSFLQQHQKRRAAGWLEEEVRTDCHQNKEPSHVNAKWKACNTLPSWNINQGGKIQKVTWFQIYSVPG